MTWDYGESTLAPQSFTSTEPHLQHLGCNKNDNAKTTVWWTSKSGKLYQIYANRIFKEGYLSCLKQMIDAERFHTSLMTLNCPKADDPSQLIHMWLQRGKITLESCIELLHRHLICIWGYNGDYLFRRPRVMLNVTFKPNETGKRKSFEFSTHISNYFWEPWYTNAIEVKWIIMMIMMKEDDWFMQKDHKLS